MLFADKIRQLKEEQKLLQHHLTAALDLTYLYLAKSNATTV